MLYIFRRKALLPLLLPALISCTFSACDRNGTKEQSGIILIVMDTARAENFSCYGYYRPTSPKIDAFAQEATFYANAMASSPWTVPTHASIFTGMDPFEHGAHRFHPGKTSDILSNPLHEKHTTLAEALASEGFATGAFIANSTYINDRYQMDQGFQKFHSELAVSDSINQWTYAWLDTLSADRFFVFINYMDTHAPYNTKPRPGFLEEPAPNDRGILQRQLKHRYMTLAPIRRGDTAALRQTVINQYDTAIANLDEQIGYLFDYLKDKGLYDRSLIIVTSDHGELFGEHQLVSHGVDVYQQLLWVPLIIKDPGQIRPRRIDDLISTSDIPHIILSQFPDELSPTLLSDFPNAPGEHPVIAENYYAHPWVLERPRLRKKHKRIRTVLYDWPYKYIHSSDEEHELYDIASDKNETNNLLTIKTDVAAKMAELLQDHKDSRSHSDEKINQDPLTEKEIKQLKSLGYIGD